MIKRCQALLRTVDTWRLDEALQLITRFAAIALHGRHSSFFANSRRELHGCKKTLSCLDFVLPCLIDSFPTNIPKELLIWFCPADGTLSQVWHHLKPPNSPSQAVRTVRNCPLRFQLRRLLRACWLGIPASPYIPKS